MGIRGGIVKHGHAIGGRTSPTYLAWANARNRCHRPKDVKWPRYGGRGISMCPRWREDFSKFLEDMGERPDGLTLDRIDNDGNYEPGNCRWATRAEQGRNRCNNRWIEYLGARMTLSQWAKHFGVPVKNLHSKLRYHKTPEALFPMLENRRD